MFPQPPLPKSHPVRAPIMLNPPAFGSVVCFSTGGDFAQAREFLDLAGIFAVDEFHHLRQLVAGAVDELLFGRAEHGFEDGQELWR